MSISDVESANIVRNVINDALRSNAGHYRHFLKTSPLFLDNSSGDSRHFAEILNPDEIVLIKDLLNLGRIDPKFVVKVDAYWYEDVLVMSPQFIDGRRSVVNIPQKLIRLFIA
jgi:hypothetical protein